MDKRRVLDVVRTSLKRSGGTILQLWVVFICLFGFMGGLGLAIGGELNPFLAFALGFFYGGVVGLGGGLPITMLAGIWAVLEAGASGVKEVGVERRRLREVITRQGPESSEGGLSVVGEVGQLTVSSGDDPGWRHLRPLPDVPRW